MLAGFCRSGIINGYSFIALLYELVAYMKVVSLRNCVDNAFLAFGVAFILRNDSSSNLILIHDSSGRLIEEVTIESKTADAIDVHLDA